jgi:hypothetical protein
VQRTGGSDKERVGDGNFHWSAGLGLQKGTFYFDGVVTNGFVTGGPNFIGGTSPGFLAMASLTYKFGDVFADIEERDGSAPEEQPLVIERSAAAPAAPAVLLQPPPSPPATVAPVPDQELAAPPPRRLR